MKQENINQFIVTKIKEKSIQITTNRNMSPPGELSMLVKILITV